MATINHKKYDEATETFKDFYVYDGKETLIFKVDGENHKVEITGTLDADNITGSGIIKTSDNGPLSATAKYLSDGLGNDSVLALSTARVFIGKTTNNDTFNSRLQVVSDNTTAGGLLIDHFQNDATGAYLFLAKSRSNVVGTSTIVQNNDTLGQIDFNGANGSTWSLGATIAAQVDGTAGATNDMPARLIFSTSADGSATPTERMRITSAGNVGIGTTSPSAKLQVEAESGSPTITLSRKAFGVPYELGNFSNSGSDLYFNGTANIFINADSNGDSTAADRNVIFGNRGTEYMRITAGGNVGVGTSTISGGALVHIAAANGTTYAANAQLRVSGKGTNNNVAQILFSDDALSDGKISYFPSAAAAAQRFSISARSTETDFNITGEGNVGIGTASPAAKLYVRDSIAGATPNAIFRVGNIGAGYMARMILTDETTADGNIVFQGSPSSASAQYIGFGIGASLDTLKLTGDGYLRLASGTGGIQFNGDTAAANALDDYEEGTFTATLTPSTSGSITGSATYHTWTYTKVGRQVTINGVFVVSSVASPVGAEVSVNLPFTVLAVNGAYGSASVSYLDHSTSTWSLVPNKHGASTTFLDFVIDASTIAANDEFYVTATYFV